MLWACFAALVLVLSIDRADTLENVFSVYRDAGLRWLHGEDLYPAQYRFNYFPPSAVFFAVFSGMPYGIEGALWRIANIAVFAAGLWRLGAHGDETATARHFMIATVVTVILSASAARYGQLTLAMSGLMMATATDLEEGHLWRAAIFAALAVAMKPLAVVLALLLFAVYPRARWRVALALLVFFVLPFLFQHPDYVLRQYAAVPGMLEARALQRYEWQHLFGLLEKLGWTVTSVEQTILTGTAAVFVLFLCWRMRSHPPAIGGGLAFYGLASCYILLFGAGTERNTFALIAPVIGLASARAWQSKDLGTLALLGALTLLMLLSHTLQHAYPNSVLAMAKPLACVVLFAWLAAHALRAPVDGIPRSTTG